MMFLAVGVVVVIAVVVVVVVAAVDVAVAVVVGSRHCSCPDYIVWLCTTPSA